MAHAPSCCPREYAPDAVRATAYALGKKHRRRPGWCVRDDDAFDVFIGKQTFVVDRDGTVR